MWENEIDSVLLSANDLHARVQMLGKEISRFYGQLNPVLLVVLKGSFMFAADLMRAMDVRHDVEFIRCSSYVGTNSTGKVKIMGLEKTQLRNRHVLVIEDIVDTGLTLKNLVEELKSCMDVASVKVCSLLEKDTTRRTHDIPNIDWIAFQIPDKFVVGYGLDVDQRFRHLPFVGVYKQ